MINDNYNKKFGILIIITLLLFTSLYIIDHIAGEKELKVLDDKTITATKTVKKTPKKVPTITMKAKPSCYTCHKNRVKYRWYKVKFVNYCPCCKHYNVLLKNPKRVPEREFTCKHCGADFCMCGRDKNGKKKLHYKNRLRRVK